MKYLCFILLVVLLAAFIFLLGFNSLKRKRFRGKWIIHHKYGSNALKTLLFWVTGVMIVSYVVWSGIFYKMLQIADEYKGWDCNSFYALLATFIGVVFVAILLAGGSTSLFDVGASIKRKSLEIPER